MIQLEPFTPTPSGWTATVVNSVMMQRIRELPVGFTYTLDEGETITPDLVAQITLDNPNYAWIIMVYNNFLDIRELSNVTNTEDSYNTYSFYIIDNNSKDLILYSKNSLDIKNSIENNVLIYSDLSCTKIFGKVYSNDNIYITIVGLDNTVLYEGRYYDFKLIVKSKKNVSVKVPNKLALMNLIADIANSGD